MIKKFILCKLCLIVFGALLAVQSALAGVAQFKLDSNSGSSLAEIEKNPQGLEFDGGDVYKFSIKHGGCSGDARWNDCVNDRQRVEFTDGYRYSPSFQSFGSKKKRIERFYRTNLFIPSEEEFPLLRPMSQMIHQVKLKQKNNPVWMVHYVGGLRVRTDGGGFCAIAEEHVPRNQWLEIEIHADYTIDGSLRPDTPFFQYMINGKVVCQIFSPLITKRAIRDAGKKQIQLKFGIYNTFPSKWLLGQPENAKWVREKKVVFERYQQDDLGESNGAVNSALGRPFDYDWPVKLPKQTLYYSDWKIARTLDDLGPSKYAVSVTSDVEENNKAPQSTFDFSLSTSELCGRALVEWNTTPGEWAKAAESRGLSAESCKLFLK